MKTRIKLILTISLIIPLVSGCSQAQTAPANQTYTASKAQPTAEFSQAQLDSLLAPIALYPDTVLSHVLIASTYPLEVVQADRWVRNNKQITGDDAVKAVENQDWDPSVKALVAFPDVLSRMSNDLEWTQQLGDAFLADESRVMDTVQNLRNKAYASGNLDKVEHVKVVREERVITIEPAVERVVYVPVYDTRVVYGSWWWPDYPPVYWHHPHGYTYVSGFYWGPRVYIGSHFFFSGCHWRDRRVVVIDRHHHHHHHSHRLYNNRSIVHYRDSRHWHHNPTHRRGVAYYDKRTRERYNSPRESYRESRTYRTNYANPNVRPNQAREQRQGDHHTNQRNSHRDDLRNQPHSGQSRITGNGRMENGRAQPQTADRAQQLRERMNNHQSRQGPSAPRTEERWNNRSERGNQAERSHSQQQTPYRGNNQKSPRAMPRAESPRTENPRTETPRTEMPRQQTPDQHYRERIERNRTQPERNESRQERAAPSYERTSPSYERPQRTERTERSERVERTERPQRDDSGGRSFRTERQDSGSGRQRVERPIRGGREI